MNEPDIRAAALRNVLNTIRQDEKTLTTEKATADNANTKRRIQARRAGLRQAAAHIADALNEAYLDGATRPEFDGRSAHEPAPVSAGEDATGEAATMAACESCWTEATRRAAYSAQSVADIYPKVLAENQPWTPERPCGGIEVGVNGAPAKPWTWCEAHMQPRGHFDRHPHTRPAPVVAPSAEEPAEGGAP